MSSDNKQLTVVNMYATCYKYGCTSNKFPLILVINNHFILGKHVTTKSTAL